MREKIARLLLVSSVSFVILLSLENVRVQGARSIENQLSLADESKFPWSSLSHGYLNLNGSQDVELTGLVHLCLYFPMLPGCCQHLTGSMVVDTDGSNITLDSVSNELSKLKFCLYFPFLPRCCKSKSGPAAPGPPSSGGRTTPHKLPPGGGDGEDGPPRDSGGKPPGDGADEPPSSGSPTTHNKPPHGGGGGGDRPPKEGGNRPPGKGPPKGSGHRPLGKGHHGDGRGDKTTAKGPPRDGGTY